MANHDFLIYIKNNKEKNYSTFIIMFLQKFMLSINSSLI